MKRDETKPNTFAGPQINPFPCLVAVVERLCSYPARAEDNNRNRARSRKVNDGSRAAASEQISFREEAAS